MMVRCIVCNDIVEYDTTWTRTTYTTCTKCRLPVEKSERRLMAILPGTIKFTSLGDDIVSIDHKYKITFALIEKDSRLGALVIKTEQNSYEHISGLIDKESIDYIYDFVKGLIPDNSFVYKSNLVVFIRKAVDIARLISDKFHPMTKEDIDILIP